MQEGKNPPDDLLAAHAPANTDGGENRLCETGGARQLEFEPTTSSPSAATTHNAVESLSPEKVVIKPPDDGPPGVTFMQYESELQLPHIMRLMKADLSEPYSIYTYRYFIHNWPNLCFLVRHTTARVH